MRILNEDVNITLFNFETYAIHEFVTPNEDGSYTIFINAGISHESQVEAFWHAMWHIVNDDFCESKTATVIEKEANNIDEWINRMRREARYYEEACF